MFRTSNNSSAQREFLINRRKWSDPWIQLNHTRFSRLGNLTLNSSIQKKLIYLWGPSSSPFPLQKPHQVQRGSGCIWLVDDSLPKDPMLILHIIWPDSDQSHHQCEGSSTVPGEGGIISFTWQVYGHSLAARVCSTHLVEGLTWHWLSRINLKGF